jgi:hypothetical protein
VKKLILCVLWMFFLLFASPIAASAQSVRTSSDRSLQLTVAGNPLVALGTGIIATKDQQWFFSGRDLVRATVGGVNANPSSSKVNYVLSAEVNGLSADGTFALSLSGTDSDRSQISYVVQGAVIGYAPSICFPSYTTAPSSCQTSDTSGIPAFFEIMLSSGQILLVETPIMNVFGGPIVIASPDGSVLIVATYNKAAVVWSNVQLAGSLSGTLGSIPVSGLFTQTVKARENFMTGRENESGTISFVHMTPSSLDSAGQFSGQSSTPTTGGIDCSVNLNLPPGTCILTGLLSHGGFALTGDNGVTVDGKYSIVWPAPSVIFSGSIAAQVNNYFVTPIFPYGTVLGILAPLAAFGSYIVAKGRRLF